MSLILCTIGLIVIVVLFSTVFNKDFMQGYRNSKFLDELMKEDQQNQEPENKELTCE